MATHSSPYYYSSFQSAEISYFSGEGVNQWLYQIEGFFSRYRTVPEQRFVVAVRYLSGEAMEWYRQMWLDRRLSTWDNFVVDLRHRFKPPEIQQSRAELLGSMWNVCEELKQTLTKMKTQNSVYMSTLSKLKSHVSSISTSDFSIDKLEESDLDCRVPAADVVLTKDESESELEVTLNRLPVVNQTVSVTKTDQYDDLNEELRSETSLGDLISSFNFRTSTVCENASMDWSSYFVTNSVCIKSWCSPPPLEHTPIDYKSVLVLKVDEIVLKSKEFKPGIVVSMSSNFCAELVRQNACEMLPFLLPPAKPPDECLSLLQPWKGIKGVQRCRYVKFIDGNYVYDKGKSDMYDNEWYGAAVEEKLMGSSFTGDIETYILKGSFSIQEWTEEYRALMIDIIVELDDVGMESCLEGAESGICYLLSPLEWPLMEEIDPNSPCIIIGRVADDKPFVEFAFKFMCDVLVGSLIFVRGFARKLTTWSYAIHSIKGNKGRVGRPLKIHLNSREGLQLLPGLRSYVGEVVIDTDRSKMLVQIHPEVKYVVDTIKGIIIIMSTPTSRVTFQNDNYTLHFILPGKVNLLGNLRKGKKGHDSTNDSIGEFDQQIKGRREVIELSIKYTQLPHNLGVDQPNGGTHDVDLELIAAAKADPIAPFTAALINGINQSEIRRSALMLLCFAHFNANVRDAFLLTVDRTGFDIVGKVPSSKLNDCGSVNYQWKEFRIPLKQEARDIGTFCEQLVFLDDHVFLNVVKSCLPSVYQIGKVILHTCYASGSKKVAQWVTKPPPRPPDIIFIYTLLIEGKVIMPIHSKVLAPLVEDMVSVTHHLDHAHFIITNTYQDVAQVDDSHQGVTLTWPYRGIHGIDAFHTVFNIVPPGVDMIIYFSYNDDYKRLTTRHESIAVVVYSSVSYARLDWVKNLKIWMFETTFLNLDFSLDDHVSLVRYINKFFLFSLPRPPEIATLRTRLILRGEEYYVLNIIEIKGSISN